MNRQRGTDGNRRAFQKGKLRPFHGLIPSVPIPSVPLRKNNAGTDGKGHKLSPSPVLGFVGSGTTGNRREPTEQVTGFNSLSGACLWLVRDNRNTSATQGTMPERDRATGTFAARHAHGQNA